MIRNKRLPAVLLTLGQSTQRQLHVVTAAATASLSGPEFLIQGAGISIPSHDHGPDAAGDCSSDLRVAVTAGCHPLRCIVQASLALGRQARGWVGVRG